MKKTYTLQINGIDKSIKDVTTLEAAVSKLDSTLEKNRAITVEATKVAKAKTSALTEEEKAAKKLEETQRKIKEAQEGANDAQIKANQELREATRLQTLRVKEEQAATNSIEAMRLELSRMKDEWKGMDVGTDEFRKMSEEIRVLNDRIKEAEQSTGDFRRNVGNYESALGGLSKLSDGIDGISKSSMGLAQSLMGGIALMSLFGGESEESAKQAAKLQKIIVLLSIAQQANNNLLKQGILQSKAASVLDAVRTTQIKAKTAAEAASTKGTIAATVAQAAFNLVASANPYVILALALVAVGAALFAFASSSENAAEKQKKLNEEQSLYLDNLDYEAGKSKEASNERIAGLERQLKVLEAQGAKTEELRAIEDKIAAERKASNEQQRGFYAQEIADLEANKEKVEDLRKELEKLQKDKLSGKGKVKLEVDGKTSKVKIDDAIDSIQGQIDNLDRTVGIATSLTTEDADLQAEELIRQAQREKADKAEAKARAKTAADAARKRADTELSIVRAAEDARRNIIEDSNKKARKDLTVTYDRQIEDLRKRLETEKDLTEKAREALSDTIVSLETKKGQDLDKLTKEQNARAIGLQQEVEDSRTALIVGAHDRQMVDINTQYDRQIAAYKKRLEEEKGLTEEQQNALTELIQNAQIARGNALAKLTSDQLTQQADLQLNAVEDALTKAENKIGEVIVRGKTGLELIDVEATRRNLEASNHALDEYIAGLRGYLVELQRSHEKTLSTLQRGTPEYEAELQNYARTVEDVTMRVADAQKNQVANTKKYTDIQKDSFKELLDKISEYADVAVDMISSVFDTFSMGLDVQVEELTEKLDILNEKYEDAQKLREDSAKNVEDIEQRLQAATGGTAVALREQLQDAMQARADAEREEKRIAKEKEKREAEIAKKEKQLKRNQLIGDIANATAGVASAVINGLNMKPFIPLGIASAVTAGITGGVQIGIMSKQLAKLADGGEIVGASHADGGVPVNINGVAAYEAEGGEFVVNKKSYSENAQLVNFINDSRRAISVADLIGVVPGGSSPVIINETPGQNDDRVVEAIEGINMRPVVSVVDIVDVSGELVVVEDLADL